MRELLKKKNAFIWTSAQQKEFEDIRETLANPTNLACFHPKLPSFLITDTSRYGLGFILYQVREDGSKALIHYCGSTSVSPTQARYSVYELEHLIIVFTARKSDYWLRGTQDITVFCNHKPLANMESRALTKVDNERVN